MRTPCLTTAWMLFWVTIWGRERTFNNFRSSSALRMKSNRKFEVKVENPSPLVGALAGKLENKGICPPVPSKRPVLGPIVWVAGGGIVFAGSGWLVMTGLLPFP